MTVNYVFLQVGDIVEFKFTKRKYDILHGYNLPVDPVIFSRKQNSSWNQIMANAKHSANFRYCMTHTAQRQKHFNNCHCDSKANFSCCCCVAASLFIIVVLLLLFVFCCCYVVVAELVLLLLLLQSYCRCCCCSVLVVIVLLLLLFVNTPLL